MRVDVGALTFLPEYSGNTHSAPAQPGWLSLVPERSERVIVLTFTLLRQFSFYFKNIFLN